MSKKKLDIKTLGYPKWFNIVFYCLTIVIPICLLIIEGLKAPSTIAGVAFKISFMVLSAGIMTWFFVKKFIWSKVEIKLLAKQTALEHDYSIDNGNSEKIKYLWFKNERRLAIFDLINVILYGGFIMVILMGVASTLMKVKGIVALVMTLYVIAYTIKFMILIVRRDDDGLEEN